MTSYFFRNLGGLALVLSFAGLSSCGEKKHSASLYTVSEQSRVKGRYIVVLDANAKSFLNSSEIYAKPRQVYANVFNGFSADLDRKQLTLLQSNPQVLGIYEVGKRKLHGIQQNPTWGLDRLDQPAWTPNKTYKYQATGKGVTAYVIDTGLKADLADFEGRAILATDLSADRGTSNENIDGIGHGTHVAGTIGSKTYGVAKEVSIVGIKVFTAQSGDAEDENVIAGIDFAIAHHLQNPGPAVLNMSLGGDPSDVFDMAVRRAVDAGMTTVVAAGNDDQDACNESPAREPKVITVAAIEPRRDRKAEFSNWGRCVHVIAPGAEIKSLSTSGEEKTADGTSMAVPHVTGIAALYLSTNPGATPAEVEKFIIDKSLKNVATGFSSSTPNRLVSTMWNNPVGL